jgi:AcrR family transcriptional regulator
VYTEFVQSGVQMAQREPNPRGEGDQLRAQLVAAASELLLTTQSIAMPSLRAVARACSVSPAAVYLHFDSQQSLLLAVLDEQTAQLRDFIHAAVEGKTGGELVRAFAIAYVEWGFAHPGGYQLLFESADQLQLEHSDQDEGWNLLIEATAIAVAVTSLPEAEAMVLAFRLWSAMHGIVSLRLHKQDAPWPTSYEVEVDAAIGSVLGG